METSTDQENEIVDSILLEILREQLFFLKFAALQVSSAVTIVDGLPPTQSHFVSHLDYSDVFLNLF